MRTTDEEPKYISSEYITYNNEPRRTFNKKEKEFGVVTPTFREERKVLKGLQIKLIYKER